MTASLSGHVAAAPLSLSLSSADDGCETEETCFRSAVFAKEQFGMALDKDQVLSLKLERLQRVMERFPNTLWAMRAGLLSGVLLLERDPAAAARFLRTAQPVIPILDDYVRLWIGEALLSLGEASQAAEMFQSIVQTSPDSSLLVKATYRASEAWYQASRCHEARVWISKAMRLSEKEPEAPQALLRQAACQLRENSISEGRETLKQLWVQFASSTEAKEAEVLLASNLGGEPWVIQPSDRFARGQVYFAQALHAEATEEFQKFLAAASPLAERATAKLKLGIAQVRLKRYDQARETFRSLAKERVAQSSEALVWLARVYLRQGQGDKLLALAKAVPASSLSSEQHGQIMLFAGIWLEDQGRFEAAIEQYDQVARVGEPMSQRAEGQWRVGWSYYRMARYREASVQLQVLANQHDSDFAPQALYWMARAADLSQQAHAHDTYQQLCQRYARTYYCQLARERTNILLPELSPLELTSASDLVTEGTSLSDEQLRALGSRVEIEQQLSYRRAIELRTLGLDKDVGRELVSLIDGYSRDPASLIMLSTMLSDAGAYHAALRLIRARFREQLERTGGAIPPSVWNVAYPTGFLSMIKSHGAKDVDPYLVAAIIREESQYDPQAVSRVGAIGLMQVMLSTASTVAKRLGLGAVRREDLFDHETNIRIGVRYVEQLLAQFSGNIVYTVASYNAGPIAVGDWITLHHGRSQDEFVELIPYQETRQYVKRVLRSYREYVRLGKPS